MGKVGPPATAGGERRIILNEISHWCRVDGAGRSEIPVVAIHGGPGGNHYVFERTILPRLAEVVTTITYEQRGCGRSETPPTADDYSLSLLVSDLDSLRSALGLQRLMLLGYSFGSEVALEYALAYPGRVAKMVLQAPCAPATLAEAAELQLRGFAAIATGEMRRIIGRIIESDETSLAKQSLVWSAVDSATVDAFLFEDAEVAGRNRELWRESGLVNTGAMERALARRSGDRPPLRDRLGGIDVPCLVLVGRHDRNVGVHQSSAVARLMPRARLHIFERSAHFPDLEEADEFFRVVVPFLLGSRPDAYGPAPKGSPSPPR